MTHSTRVYGEGASVMARRLLGAALLIMAGPAACSKVPLTAPTSSTIILSAASTIAQVNGQVELTATVTEQSGTPVQNGTVVTFTTTLGTIDPREARTHNGSVTARLNTGSVSGTAQITAVSGAAKTDKPVEVKIGAAAIGRLDLTVSPTTLLSTGGTSQVVATAVDSNGNRLAGVQVFFSVDVGALSTGSAVTDQNGEARTVLTTTRAAKVTATAGGSGGTGGTAAATATANIQLNVLPTITIALASGAAPVEDQPVSFTLTVTPNQNGAAIRDVTVDFGNARTTSLGAVSGTTSVSTIYSSDGSYRVTATVTDALGERTSSSTQVSVGQATPLTVTIGNPTATKVQTAIPFSATVLPSGVSIARYDWTFGDGTGCSPCGPSTTHVYGTVGHRIVTVTAIAADGRTGVARIEIIVTE